MTDEQILAAWDKEVHAEPLTLELAKIEGSLRGVATCLREAGTAMSEYSDIGDYIRFFAQEVLIQAEKLTKLREKMY